MKNLSPQLQQKTFSSLWILCLCFPLLWGCRSQEPEPAPNYSLLEKDGIFTEQFDSTNVEDGRYTENNETFKAGSVFIYSFKHISKEGEEYFFRFDPSYENRMIAWHFVPVDSVSETTHRQVRITVKPGLEPMINNVADYDQTVIQFEYPIETGRSAFSSHSGVIENEKNIWMHPPRDQYFRILELNPFPFIKAPYEVGNTWQWELGIGGFWGDERWKTWEGSINNEYRYEITDKKAITTIFGDLEVYEITATAQSELGETGLTALFDEQYGFIELDYENIDGSRTLLELVEYSTPPKASEP